MMVTARFQPIWRISLGDNQVGRIVSAYREDRPIEEITSRFSISTRTLYRLLEVEEIPLRCEGRGRKPNLDPEKEREIVEAHSANVSMSDIRRRFGIGWDTYQSVLKKNGIAPG